MQIKDLLQSLIDDGLVNAEKCGITNLYWCFEYDKQKKIKDMIDKEEMKVKSLNEQLKTVKLKLKAEQNARRNWYGESKREEIESLQSELKSLQDKFVSKGFNADRIKEVQFELQQQIETGETCTDNIESMLYYFKNSSGVDRKTFTQELGIPEEFKDFPDLNNFFSTLS